MAFSLALGVTPPKLKNQSKIIDTDIDNMAKYIAQLQKDIEGTKGYWIGEAGDKQRQIFDDNMKNINLVIERLRTYPSRVLNMAGIYENANERSRNVANRLNTTIPSIMMQ